MNVNGVTSRLSDPGNQERHVRVFVPFIAPDRQPTCGADG